MERMMSMTSEKQLSATSDISWPKDFPELKLIDDILRCGICYDYIKTCMVTPCAHSYCSICIRRSLLYKTACPSCFEETYETNLRNNRNFDRVTELFVNVRDKLIKHLRIAAVHFNCNEKLQSPATTLNLSQKTSQQEETPKRNIPKPGKSSTKGKLPFKSPSLGSSDKKSEISKRLEDLLVSPAPHTRVSEKKVLNSFEISNDDEFQRITTVPPMFLQPKVESQPKNTDVPTVPCPVCGVDIPERNINPHLDNCLANVNKPPVKSPVKRQKRNPLPKMVWSLMAEKDLRKKLKDYGLNTQGEKKALISRIQRYILLYNSECDSDSPRPVSEIVRQVEKEEKPTPNPTQQRLVINKKSDPKLIEEENQKYLQDNKDSFKKLIEAMKTREGRNIRPTSRNSNVILSDDDDDEDEDICREQREVPNVTPSISLNTPSTSNAVWEHVDLSDSDSNSRNGLSSPVLGARVSDNKSLCNGITSASARGSSSPVNLFGDKRTRTIDNKVTTDDLELKNPHKDSPMANDNSFSSPPKRRLSSSCIITTHSDSEDSMSLLVDQNIDGDFLDALDVLGPATEDVRDHNSQLEDPDFVVDTEEQNENCSEEVFVPTRKSKRKLKSPVLGDSNQNSSPRRTRRRTSK
uniref:RING-type E3 ubiquitin transferase n=1 Tax=Graphocephala atropunctata TaxID=36148 RepID=A0A1B6MH69_9HEMI